MSKKKQPNRLNLEKWTEFTFVLAVSIIICIAIDPSIGLGFLAISLTFFAKRARR